MTTALAFWKAVVQDKSDFLEGILALLADNHVPYCAIGGVAVNAYAPAVLTEDMDLVVMANDLDLVKDLCRARFKTREFEHSFNVYDPGSRLQVQFQLGDGFDGFVDRAQAMDVLGLTMPVANPADLIDAKVAAALEPSRRGSKRLKDFADIRRLVDAMPELRTHVPPALEPHVFFDE